MNILKLSFRNNGMVEFIVYVFVYMLIIGYVYVYEYFLRKVIDF